MSHGKEILYLIKFFTQKEYAEQFMDGNLYMNRLSFFKKIEDTCDDGRLDRHEAISHWWQPHDLIIKLNVPKIGEIKLTKTDLAAPVSMAFDIHNDLHIFSMYAMSADEYEDVEKLREQLKIDKRCCDFGEHAVIVPAVKFIEKSKVALIRNNRKSRMASVNYFDDETFHGSIDKMKIPFNKLKKYSYQNEFRICIDNKTKGDDPFILRIGSIREFSALVKSSDLNGLFSTVEIQK